MLAENLSSTLDLFKTKSPSLIGVDIASTSLKLVELSDAGKGLYRLERYVIEPLPKDVVADGNILNIELAGDVLKRAWKRLGTRNRNAALALPAAMVITKKIIVAAGQREEDLELTVEAEANQYIPFALDEVNLDFQTIGPAPNNPDEVEVLIAASRKEKVEDRVAVAESAGLKARVMDVESYATQEAFRLIAPSLPANGRDQNIALVDIGAHVSHFYVLRNNQILFSRDQAFGGNQLTQDIQRAFNLSSEEAESARKNQGLPENYDHDVLQPFMQVEIRKDSVGELVNVQGGGQVPAIDTKNVLTSIAVNNGDTAVIGGIYEEVIRNDVTKVPFLGDVPVVGYLFKTTDKTVEKQELLIFLTPRVLKDSVTAVR